MPGKVDKPLQNRAIQGILEQEKFMIKVLFICLGNICRSTMAQSIFTHLVNRQHLDTVFGNPPHYGTKNKLYEEHIPLIPHHARQMSRDDYLYYDFLIGMDTANIRNMTRIAGGSDSQQKIFKMLSFADYGTNHKLTAARDVADPWYTGDFDATFDDVMSGCGGLLEYIKEVYNL